MILSALADYYDQLLHEHPEDIARPGWSTCKVSFLLVLSPEGVLVNIIPAEDKTGWIKQVPERVKRSVGVAPNAFCDNATYLLGIDDKDKPERSRRCFETAKELHLAILDGTCSPQANAVRSFFQTWNPSCAKENQVVIEAGNDLLKGGNLTFVLYGEDVLRDPAICNAWENFHTAPSDDSVVMRCLVTGERAPIARIHPAIKGLYGAKAVASLVGFNARAFESYGHVEEQGFNAPVSEHAAFAYATSLNYLLAQQRHHIRIGDTTIVYWATRGDDAASEAVSYLLGNLPKNGTESDVSSDPQMVDETIDSIMNALASGKLSELGGLDPSAQFYLLGLAPSAARISVRFFIQNTFGNLMENLQKHYQRLEISGPSHAQKYLSPWRLVMETENPNAKNTTGASELGGALMRSILTDDPYPEALYMGTLLRVRATRDDADRHIKKITRVRAAIIKSYLIKNQPGMYREGTMECLDESRDEVPYLLGRLFCRLEELQYQANPDVSATIKDKYFDAACATPALVFPTLLKLAEKHAAKIRKDKVGAAKAYGAFTRMILSRVSTFPAQFSSAEQGDFILGYYHQQTHDIDARVRAKQERENAEAISE